MSGVLKGLDCTEANAFFIDEDFCYVTLSVNFGSEDRFVNLEMSLDILGDAIDTRPIGIQVGEDQTDHRGNSFTIFPEDSLEDWKRSYRSNGDQGGTLLPESMLPQLFDVVSSAYPKIITPWIGKRLSK